MQVRFCFLSRSALRAIEACSARTVMMGLTMSQLSDCPPPFDPDELPGPFIVSALPRRPPVRVLLVLPVPVLPRMRSEAEGGRELGQVPTGMWTRSSSSSGSWRDPPSWLWNNGFSNELL